MALSLPPSGEAGEDRYAPLAEINVTPMVDVMLVLLVIFMVTAPLLTVGVPLDLPKSRASQLTEPKKPVIISLNRDGEVFIGDERVNADELEPRLAALATEDPNRIVYVRSDPGSRRLQQDHGRSRPFCRAHARADRKIGRSARPRRRGGLTMALSLPPSGEAGEERYAPLAEINVTPMVDVMLVLLVIFMVTAPLLTVGVPLDLPKSRATTLTEPKKPVIISLNRDGEVFIGDERVDADQLEPRLAALAAEDPNRIVYVRSDKTNTYAQLMDALGLVNHAGFSKVSLIAEAAGPK